MEVESQVNIIYQSPVTSVILERGRSRRIEKGRSHPCRGGARLWCTPRNRRAEMQLGLWQRQHSVGHRVWESVLIHLDYNYITLSVPNRWLSLIDLPTPHFSVREHPYLTLIKRIGH